MKAEANRLPSGAVLREMLDYDPATGALTYRAREPRHFQDGTRFSAQARCNMWNGRFAGKPAFDRVNSKGYCVGHVADLWAFAHRVIWKLVHDEEPVTVDHIDGDPSNNRLLNLRAATHLDQARNNARPKHNTSGHVGVSRGASDKWKAQISVKGRSLYLGQFRTLEEAVAARRAAEMEHGFHENHGRAKP